MDKEYIVNVYIMTDKFNVPEYINKIMERELEKQNHKYLFFLQNDIFSNLKDKELIFEKYVEFMKKYDLPFVIYPYYIHINSVLPNQLCLPNPNLSIKINNDIIDILHSPAYGFLGIDLEKFNSINFRFKTDFPIMFYLQNMFEEFYQKGLTLSNCCYLDFHNSHTYFTTHTPTGFHQDMNKFNEEKTKYYEKEFHYRNMTEFIEAFKEKYCKKQIKKDIPLINDDKNISIISM